MLSEYKTKLSLLNVTDAQAEAKELLEATQKKMGFIPNMYKAMAHSPGLLNTYLQGYAAFREESGFSPAEQEVIFLTISHSNGCEYCMAAHSFLAEAVSGVPTEVTDAIRDSNEIPEIKLRALSVFTEVMLTKRGLPSKTDVDLFLKAGYQETAILEVIHAIAVKTISNYTNHIFHTDLDEVFSKHVWNDSSH
ncbi:MAG: carboxymuconolactone decarboxylase family protein [Cocleimonas sp.]